MFGLAAPRESAVRAQLELLAGVSYSYREVGALKDSRFPAGYEVDRHSVLLGTGADCFVRAKAALSRWEMFHVGWVQLHPSVPRTDPGSMVGIAARFFFLWTLSSCRVAYAVDERGEVERFGFALGTLPGHVLAGEEEFCVEWRHADDSVWYAVRAFSRPVQVLSRLGYPIVRALQARFARDSHAAMLQASRA